MDLQSLPWWGQFLVFLLVGLIFLAIFYFSFYTKNQDTINRIQGEIDQVETEIKRAEQKEDKLPQIREEIAQKEAYLEKLKEILPETKEITQILKKIESLIIGARLKLNGIVQRSQIQREIYIEHPYSLTLEGNYHNLGIFFDQLSKLKKIFTVNGLTLRPQNQVTREQTITASFTASTYTYQEAPPPPAAPRARRRRG